MSTAPRNCFVLAADATAMGIDAWTVVSLRLLKLAGGGPEAMVEARRMFEEKVIAHNQFAKILLSGRAGSTPHAVMDSMLLHYRPWISANRQRLLRACTEDNSG